MKQICVFNDSTEEYLKLYYRILNTMIFSMTRAKLTNSISHNFIVQMIPHHKAAIEMSENILKYTSNPTLKTIASRIISEQTKSIENMLQVKESCSALTNSQQDLHLYQRNTNKILQTMFSHMKNARATNNISCDFMWEMIPHHQGAVEMSTNTLMFDICPELSPILHAIIQSQKEGIQQMRRLLKEIGCR